MGGNSFVKSLRRVAARRWAIVAPLALMAIVAAGCVPAAPPAARFRPGAPPVSLTMTSARHVMFTDSTTNDVTAQTISIRNDGPSTSAPLWIPFAPSNTIGTWTVTNDHCSNQRLGSLASCTFDVNFSSDVWYPFDDTQSYTVTDGSSSVVVNLTGEAAPRVAWYDGSNNVVADAPIVERSAAAAGPTSYVATLKAANAPIGPLSVGLLPVPGNTGTFTVGTDGCTGNQVSPSSPCTIEVRYDNTTGSGTDGVILVVNWADGSSALPILGQGTP